MGAITLFKNESAMVDLPYDFTDNGWVISGGKATHYPCNNGLVRNLNIPTEAGKTYTIDYSIEGWVSGSVKVIVGGVDGSYNSSNGTYEETLMALDNSGIIFYSDGKLTISIVKISSGTKPAITFAFNENANKWVTYYSFEPEMMAKFINSFFTFKNGQLWEHNVNEIRNNFYGQQFTSKVRFVSNTEYEKEKLWYNIRLDSKGNWSAPSLITPANDLFPNGMESRLKKGNFKSIDGKLWADILRDKKDPRFNSITDQQLRELEALFKGRVMQGAYLVVELECADTTEAKLASAEVYYIDLERSL